MEFNFPRKAKTSPSSNFYFTLQNCNLGTSNIPRSWRCCFGTSLLQDKYRSMKSIVKWYVSLCILYTSHTYVAQKH